MIEERLKNIERPELSEEVMERHLRAITGEHYNQAELKRQSRAPFLLPKVLTFVVSSLAALLLLFVIGTSNPPPYVQDKANNIAIENIVKATMLSNSKPEKLLNVTSVFYLDKQVSTDHEALQAFEQIFATAPTEPFDWDGIRANPSDDILFELATGEQVYVKSFIAVEGGGIYVVNMNTMERYVFDYELNKAYWEASDTAFIEEDSPTWPYVAIFALLIGFIIRQHLRYKARTVDTEDMPNWLQAGLLIVFGFAVSSHEIILGAFHIGFEAVFVNVFAIIYSTIQTRFYNVRTSWLEKLEIIVILNLMIVLFCFIK